MEPHRYLVAGPLWLDRKDERLWREGRLVRLGGKALALLRMLMEHPQTLVTKAELFDRVWPGLAVSESVLTTAIKEVRRALGDDARRPHIVETVHGRGYRFLLDVESSEQPPTARAGVSAAWRVPRRVLLVAVAALVVAAAAIALVLANWSRDEIGAGGPHPKSIAVLPFDDLSSTSDQGWLAAGLTEEILNSLTRTPDLRVAARTSTAKLPDGDIREIGRRLNVSHVLEGSVRRDGDRVRVTAQLIRASDGFHLWSENFDRPTDDIISIQEGIAVAIARSLQTVMSPDRLQAMVRLGTRSVDAYQEYLKGLAHERRELESGDPQYAHMANAAYERARAMDPQFAAAHWEAASYWFGMATRIGAASYQEGDEDRRLKEYLARVNAAIASSDGRPENYKYRSARALMNLQFKEALRLMQFYLREHPRDVPAWEEVVAYAGYAGDRRFMARVAERIHTLSTESGVPLSSALTASVLSLDIGNAVRRARQQLEMRPGEAIIQYQAHRALLWGGHQDEARDILGRIRQSSLPPENILLAELRQACADGGAGAGEFAEKMRTLPNASTSGAWHTAMLMGDTRRASEVLAPLHKPKRLTTLMQFLVYPTFDVRPFPLLEAKLVADGVRRAPSVAIPFACRRTS